ncbi:MAG: hypothetical protein ACRD2U_17460 [Terriglobales bacterium]
MRVSRWMIAFFLVVMLPSALLAADLTGRWIGPMQTGGNAAFTLKSEKDAITGTMTGADGKEYPITEGKLEGDNVSFTVAPQWQGNPVNLIVSGKVSGDQMQVNIHSDNGYWSTDATVKKQPMK